MEHLKKKLDVAGLKEILDCFVILTGIRAAYIDTGKEAISGIDLEACGFCKAIREYNSLDESCRACDAHAFKTAEENKKTYLYTCHMGLWEAVVPLYVKNHLTGFLMLGQARGQSSEDSWDDLFNKIQPICKDAGILHNIKEKYESMPQYSRKQIEASAKMLELMASHIVHSEIIDVQTSQKVEKVKQYINLHSKGHISTRILAEQLNISQTALCNAFKKETGMTISGYADGIRIKQAKDLLKTTALSIKEISAQLGYSDQNYFSRQFKKRSGTSPEKFRKLLG